MSLARFLTRGFRPPSEVVTSALGHLERRVLEELWRRGAEASVRDVHTAFAGELAYTTLMTTLDRLHRKGLLERRRAGRAFVYRPHLPRAQFERHLATQMIDGLLACLGGASQPLLATLVDAVGRRDRELLDELERLARERRLELDRDSAATPSSGRPAMDATRRGRQP